MKIFTPLLLTTHALVLFAFMAFCTDADNPGIWGVIYYFNDPLFFGLFGVLFKNYYIDTNLNRNFISVWGLMNIGRFISYYLNDMGYMNRNWNLLMLIGIVIVGTIIVTFSASRYGIFKNANNG